MEFFKKNKNYLYIVVILIAVIAMLVLLTDYKKNANSEPSLADIAATESTVKKSPAKVIVTVNTETIREGIAKTGGLRSNPRKPVEHLTQ